MVSSKLTVEQLIEIANTVDDNEGTSEITDISDYIIHANLHKGSYSLNIKVLYIDYLKWSKTPVDFNYFSVILKAKFGNNNYVIYVDRSLLTINIAKAVGDFIKNEKKRKEEERLRQIRSSKSKTKRKNKVRSSRHGLPKETK